MGRHVQAVTADTARETPTLDAFEAMSDRCLDDSYRLASVVLRDPVEGRRTWEGILAGYADGIVSLETEPGKTREFPFEQVRTANLKFEW